MKQRLSLDARLGVYTQPPSQTQLHGFDRESPIEDRTSGDGRRPAATVSTVSEHVS